MEGTRVPGPGRLRRSGNPAVPTGAEGGAPRCRLQAHFGWWCSRRILLIRVRRAGVQSTLPPHSTHSRGAVPGVRTSSSGGVPSQDAPLGQLKAGQGSPDGADRQSMARRLQEWLPAQPHRSPPFAGPRPHLSTSSSYQNRCLCPGGERGGRPECAVTEEQKGG